MGKIVKTVLIIAVAVAIVVFAAPIATALTAAFAAIGMTVAVTTAAIVGVGISLGLTAVMGLFRKVPSLSNSLTDRLNTSVIPVAPRKIVFGRTAAGNDVRFFEDELDLPSTKKDGYAQVIALASHRIHSVLEWYTEDELSWTPSTGIKGKNAGGIRVFRPVLEGVSGAGIAFGSGLYWKSTASFTGCAYAQILWKLDTEIWTSGIPSRLTTVVEGCPVYDPRRDSTMGGSGPHRWNDNRTWEYRSGSVDIGRNPALCLLTYLLGWKVNGKAMWGMSLEPSRINIDNFKVYANLCEELVLTKDGGTVQRYTADGMVSTADSHDTVINQLTAAMGSCKLTDVGGVYTIIGGYDDTFGPRQAFTADDLVAPAGSAQPYSWIVAPSVRDSYNIARGRFPDPAEMYQLVDWGVIETDVLPDGIPRTMSVDLAFVSRAESCQRIAKQMLLREAITPGVFSATFGPKAFAVNVGSLVTLSLPDQGWNNKLFRVMEQAESHDLFFAMTLREESAEVYAWDKDEGKPLPSNPRPKPYDPTMTITPSNLACDTETFTNTDGVSVSQVAVTWDAEGSGRIGGIQIQSRPQGFGTVAWTEQAALVDASAGSFIFISNLPNAVIDVRARYRMTTGIYSPWVLANILSAATETKDNYARDIAEEAAAAAEEAQGDLDNVRRELPALVLPILQEPIDQISAGILRSAATQTKATIALHKQNLVAISSLGTRVDENGALVAEQITQLTSRVGDGEATVEAGFLEVNRTIADGDEALAESITSQIANFSDDVSAALVEEQTVRANADEAISNSVATLQSATNGNIATVQSQVTAHTTDLGAINASYTMKLQTTLPDGTKVLGGFGIANNGSVVDTAFLTDAFRVYVPGVSPTQIFYLDGEKLIIGPEVFINNANIETLTLAGDKLQPSAVTSIGSFERDYDGWHLSSGSWNYLGGSDTETPSVSIRTGNGDNKVILQVVGVFERDGGDDDNLNVTIERRGGSGTIDLSINEDVQVASGRRTFAFAWVDSTVADDTDYQYYFKQRSIGADGAPYWQRVTFFGICHKK